MIICFVHYIESTPFGGKVHGIRSLGSATMDMVYVAAGQADIMYEGAPIVYILSAFRPR